MTDEFELPKELQSLDRSLRCAICRELFSVPVSLKCGHCCNPTAYPFQLTFCSKCIRAHISCSQTDRPEVLCPACRQPAQEGDIRRDLTLACAVGEYKGIRPRLIDRVSGQSSSLLSPQENEVIHEEEVTEKIKVPPILHKASATANRLRGMLKEWGLPIDGNKDALWTRYRSFRSFVCTENDQGSQLSHYQVAQKFMKQSKSTQKQDQGYFLRSINGDENLKVEKWSFDDLLEEIKKRKST